MRTLSTTRKDCPICGKSLSYGDVFSKHGYQVKYHRHTNAVCFGAYRPEEGLVEKYVQAMQGWLKQELLMFPGEWLGMTVFSMDQRRQKAAWSAFQAAKQLKADIVFFEKRLGSAS